MNMADKAKKTFIASEWGIANLKESKATSQWTDPVTGIKDVIFYMVDNGLSKNFDTPDGNLGVVIKGRKPDMVEPDTKMVVIPNGRAVIATCPPQMMVHLETLALMSLEDFQKLSAKVSTALTEGVFISYLFPSGHNHSFVPL